MKSVRTLRVLGLVILLLLAGGTFGYMTLEGMGFLDALYMTVITLSTVGFEEVHPLGGRGEAFTIALIVFGVGTMSFAVFSVGQILIEGELRRLLGRRYLERKIKSLEGHYIVCGYGRVGSVVADQLTSAGIPIVVVDASEEKLQQVSEKDLLYVRGDATLEEVLEEANVSKARGLVTAVATDADNLFITLTAREMNQSLYIVSRAFDERSESKLMRAGADRVVAPTYTGAIRISQAILRPAVVELIELATHRESLELQMEELRVKPGSELSGLSLKESPIRSRFGLIVIAVKRADGSMEFNPPSETVLKDGDLLITVGRPENLKQLEGLLG